VVPCYVEQGKITKYEEHLGKEQEEDKQMQKIKRLKDVETWFHQLTMYLDSGNSILGFCF